MKVVQVYLPCIVSETIVFNGYSQPLLRYYEKLVAVHLAPVIFKSISLEGWQKFLYKTKKFFGGVLRDLGYYNALLIVMTAVLFMLASKNNRFKNLLKLFLDIFGGFLPSNLVKKGKEILARTPKTSEAALLEQEVDKEKMFTEIVLDKQKLKMQFIAIPVDSAHIKSIFNPSSNPDVYKQSFKKQVISSLKTLEVYDDVSIKPLVFEIPCVVCTVDEVDTVKKNAKSEGYSLLVLDPVNEVVTAKVQVAGKEFVYSVPLSEVVRKRQEKTISLDKLASVLKGTKIGGQI